MKESAKSRDVKAVLSDTELSNTELSNIVRVSSGLSICELMLLETRHVVKNQFFKAEQSHAIKNLFLYYMAESLQEFAFKPATNKNIKPIAGLRPATLLMAVLIEQCCKLIESVFEKFFPPF